MPFLTKLAVRLAAPIPNIERFDRFLFVGPHPDDIEIGTGASAAKLAAEGKTVAFLICTDGRFGTENYKEPITQEALAQLRRQEAISSAACLGVHDVRFLSFSDGGLYRKEELFQAILQCIGDFQPDVVFAPDPCVPSECHTDHLNVGEAVRRAVCFAPFSEITAAYNAGSAPVKALAYYMTANANSFIRCSRALYEKQLAAIFHCHRSQFPAGCNAEKALRLYLGIRSLDMGLHAGALHGEGFRVLGTTHMHCLPEAQ